MHFPAIATVARPTDPGQSLSTAGDRETILLVEDEDSVRAVVSAVLRRQGYQVLEASTARAARDIFAQHGAGVALLLSDVVMPGMNGPALADSLTVLKPDLQVLFISGYSDLALPLDADDPNVSFLSKPFQASVLTAKVKDALARRHSTL
jgi:DNA-binding NtrC family response regulator